MVENLSAPYQLFYLTTMLIGTLLMYFGIVKPVAQHSNHPIFVRLIMTPIWLILIYAITTVLTIIVYSVVNGNFQYLAIQLVLYFVFVIVPYPINSWIAHSVVGEGWSFILFPIWFLSGWGLLLSVIAPVMALIRS